MMAVKCDDNRRRIRLARLLWNWIPHPTQREWLENTAKVKVAACGRRWGKTEAAAVDTATAAITRPGSVQMIVAPTYDQSRLIFGTVENLLLNSPVTRSLVKVTRTPYPRLTLGRSLVMARTADEDGRNLRGHSADRVMVDEAAYVRDAVINEVISPMLADRDGELVMISTPFGKNHFYQAFMKGRSGSGRVASFTFPSAANPHISAAYIESQRQEISPRQFAVEYEARFIDDQASVFAWEDIEAAARAGRTRDTRCVAAGVDWARYSDYTAAVAVSVTDSGCEVIGIDRFNRIGWTEQVERVAAFLKAHRAGAVLVDQTSIGDPLLEQLRSRLWKTGADVRADGFTFTNQSKQELVERLAARFAQRTVSIPRDEHLMKELQYYEYELTASGNVRMNARRGYHDDLVIALALACRQAEQSAFSGAFLSCNGRKAAAGW